MKMPLVLILPALLIATMNSRLDAQPTLPATGETQSSIELSPRFTNTVIEPGLGVGPLKMGDSRDRALVVFPRNDRDQEAEDQCGTTLDWVDVTNPMGRGDVFIRIKKDKVFQIESATTRFQTAEGITTFDPPEKVASAYKNLRAYVLLTALTHDLGDRPLVFWVDKKKGIAFSFAYDVPRRKRYVYKVIVFEPNKNFCPEQETTKSLRWQEIPAYAVEPPKELSPER